MSDKLKNLIHNILKEDIQQNVPIQQPIKKKAKLETPFQVLFSERGFLFNDTRLSFEELETALSKNYNIVLNSGNGLVLDAVRMQKIMKYKNII